MNDDTPPLPPPDAPIIVTAMAIAATLPAGLMAVGGSVPPPNFRHRRTFSTLHYRSEPRIPPPNEQARIDAAEAKRKRRAERDARNEEKRLAGPPAGLKSSAKPPQAVQGNGFQPLSLEQASWYFSDQGSDFNVGDSPTNPIVSNAEYVKRTGNVRDVPQDTTLYHMSDRPASDPLRQVLIPRATIFSVFPINLGSIRQGTVGAYLPDNYATPEAALFSDVSNTATFPVGKLIRMTSGPRAGNLSPFGTSNGFYIAKDLGSGKARVQTPTYRTSSNLLNAFEFSPSIGETYEIVEPRKLYMDFTHSGIVGSRGNVMDAYFCAMPGGFATGDDAIFSGQCDSSCYWWTRFPFASFAQSVGNLMSCCLGLISVTSGVTTSYHALHLNAFASFFYGKWQLGGKTLLQGCGPWDFANSGSINSHGSSGAQMVFDSTGTVFSLTSGSVDIHGEVFGKGNVGCFAELTGDGVLNNNFLFHWNFLSTANVNGTGGYDFKINDDTQLPAMNPTTFAYDPATIPLTYAKLIAAFGAGGTGGFGGSIKHPIHGARVVKGY